MNLQNVFNYLEWRGDLTLSNSPFNPVDALILSLLSYVPFETAMQVWDSKTKIHVISLQDASSLMFDKPIDKDLVRDENDVLLLKKIAKTNRFKDMQLFSYVHSIDYSQEKQFAALCIHVDKNTSFISYRGTDLTIIGWKEDFNMSFLFPVPAQEAALEYFCSVSPFLHKKIHLGGHSKGGNLAVFASACAPLKLQKRIVNVYNNDGPGFTAEAFKKDGFRKIETRIQSFVPESSIIGMLLEHAQDYTIVSSEQVGILQHDPYSWNILGKDFVRVSSISKTSLLIDETISGWLREVQMHQREQFIDALFDIINSTNAKNFSEFTNDWLKNVTKIGKSLARIDPETKKMLLETLVILAKVASKNILTHIQEE